MNALRDLLDARARRTPSAVDLDALMSSIRARADQRAARSRNLRAGGGGVLVVGAVVAIVLAVAPGTGKQHLPAGQSVPSQSSVPYAGPVQPATSAAAKPTMLVAIPPAPPKAELSIGLVPKGSIYVGRGGPDTFYGAASRKGKPTGDFTKEIVVDVHNRLRPDYPHRLTVAGRPAAYSSSKYSESIDIIYTKKIDIDIQFPATPHLTRAQVLRIAATMDVRSTKVRSSG